MDPSDIGENIVVASVEKTPDRATPATGSKKRKTPASKDTKERVATKSTPSEAKDTPEPAAKRQRKKGYTPQASRPIGRSYDELEDCDRKLMDLYAEGKGWGVIRKEWEKLTGDKVEKSTLPNRYQRIMTNLSNIKDEDKVKLIVAKQQIENQFEEEKWSKVAALMHEDGTQLYPGEVLRRQHKQILLFAETLPPVGKTVEKTDEDSVLDGDDE